jgi:hypothetical protein
MSQAQAQVANGGNSLEAAPYLQTDVLSRTEGWEPFGGTQEGAYALTEAFTNLGITGADVTQQWIDSAPGWIVPNLDAPDILQGVYAIVTNAEFFNSFVPTNGVIIDDNNLNVAFQMKGQYGDNWRSQEGSRVTHIQQVRVPV